MITDKRSCYERKGVKVMSDCGCKDTKVSTSSTLRTAAQSALVTAADPFACTQTIHDTVDAAAELVITPNITVTNVNTICVGVPEISFVFPPDTQPFCSFTVIQEVCAQFDVNFGVTVTPSRGGLICGQPAVGECSAGPTCPSTSTVRPEEPANASFTLNFLGAMTLPNGQQLWTYQLTNNTPRSLRRWAIVPCNSLTLISCTASTEGGVTIPLTCTTTNEAQDAVNCLPEGQFAIVLTPGGGNHPAGATITYHIIVDQTYPIGTVVWGAEAGESDACGQICGPCPA